MAFRFVFCTILGFTALMLPTAYQLSAGVHLPWIITDGIPIALIFAAWWVTGLLWGNDSKGSSSKPGRGSPDQ
jgi:TRAP-type C4-dicarboxylate transport system permease small subunit